MPDRTSAATIAERAIARLNPNWTRAGGPFGEDITNVRTGVRFEVKTHRSAERHITTPNNAQAVENARARKAWVCFAQVRGKRIGKLVWYRSDTGTLIPCDREHYGKLQRRFMLKFNPTQGVYEIPHEVL
ncbi:hypothetical protein L0Y49_03190 [bacterium]|nr:hypothetical protein [bacterium]